MDRPRVAAVREETERLIPVALSASITAFTGLRRLINKDVQILTDDTTIVVSRKGVFVTELDKASSVYRPPVQEEKEAVRKSHQIYMDERYYCQNALQRPLSDYAKVTGVW